MSEAAKNNQSGGLIKNALILFLITLVAGVALGVVYELTKGEIARQEAQAIVDANKAVFATADSFEVIYDAETENADLVSGWEQVKGGAAAYSSVNLVSVTEAYAGGSLAGYVINIASGGYSSDVTFSIGMTNEGHLNGISIISIAESPGLGMEAEPVLVPQFANGGEGRDDMPFSLIKNADPEAGQIRAITSATITSNAVTNGVNAGVELFNSVLKKGAN